MPRKINNIHTHLFYPNYSTFQLNKLMPSSSNPQNQRPILGYFFFKDLGDGCLGSKYSNTINFRLFSECAVRAQGSIVNRPDNFIGQFVTSWLESDANDPIVTNQANLFIEIKPGTQGGQYRLRWQERQEDQTILYHGEGMLCGLDLVGCYWDTNIQTTLDGSVTGFKNHDQI